MYCSLVIEQRTSCSLSLSLAPQRILYRQPEIKRNSTNDRGKQMKIKIRDGKEKSRPHDHRDISVIAGAKPEKSTGIRLGL